MSRYPARGVGPTVTKDGIWMERFQAQGKVVALEWPAILDPACQHSCCGAGLHSYL